MQKNTNKTNGFNLKLQYSSIFIAACLFMNTFLSVLANLRSTVFCLHMCLVYGPSGATQPAHAAR